MNVSIVGSGYVGTTLAACLADLGHDVVNVDVDEDIVATINAGEAPIHEPGLDELLDQYAGDRLRATTDYDAIRETDVTFLALPTPSREDGSIDLSIMEAAAESLGEVLTDADGPPRRRQEHEVIPGGTDESVVPAIEAGGDVTRGEEFEVAMNPEFLRMGTAVDDFTDPDKIVFGADEESAYEALDAVYDPLVEQTGAPVVRTGIREAEMIKYANNAFPRLEGQPRQRPGERLQGVRRRRLRGGRRHGPRRSHRRAVPPLRTGVGGSCFPKDVDAIRAAARDVGYEPAVLDAAVEVNDHQPERLLSLLDDHVDVAGSASPSSASPSSPAPTTSAGRARFRSSKDSRNAAPTSSPTTPSPSSPLREYAPEVEFEAADSAGEALQGAHGAVVATDWDEFAALDAEFDGMADPSSWTAGT